MLLFFLRSPPFAGRGRRASSLGGNWRESRPVQAHDDRRQKGKKKSRRAKRRPFWFFPLICKRKPLGKRFRRRFEKEKLAAFLLLHWPASCPNCQLVFQVCLSSWIPCWTQFGRCCHFSQALLAHRQSTLVCPCCSAQLIFAGWVWPLCGTMLFCGLWIIDYHWIIWRVLFLLSRLKVVSEDASGLCYGAFEGAESESVAIFQWVDCLLARKSRTISLSAVFTLDS